jgi:hypothetical protein
MIHGQRFFDRESLVLKGAISNSRIFHLGQTRQLLSLEVAVAGA